LTVGPQIGWSSIDHYKAGCGCIEWRVKVCKNLTELLLLLQLYFNPATVKMLSNLKVDHASFYVYVDYFNEVVTPRMKLTDEKASCGFICSRLAGLGIVERAYLIYGIGLGDIGSCFL
jgi:hypothetical protein